MPLTRIEGMVQDLQRTSEVRRHSGEHTRTTTSHICLFKLGEHRVELRLGVPAPLSDGDTVRVAGNATPGLFKAAACHNVTTGWHSPKPPFGCLVVLVVFLLLFGVFFGGIIALMLTPKLFIVGPLFTTGVAFLILLPASSRRKAYKMVSAP